MDENSGKLFNFPQHLYVYPVNVKNGFCVYIEPRFPFMYLYCIKNVKLDVTHHYILFNSEIYTFKYPTNSLFVEKLEKLC